MKVKRLISMFNGIAFQHIYREYNDVADILTNVGIGDIDGFIHFAPAMASHCHHQLSSQT